jgi:hypothetical protein
VILLTAYFSFPYVRSGADLVRSDKIHRLANKTIFPREGKLRIVVFGNSKILAGFVPRLFDQLSGDVVYSYNAGLPGTSKWIAHLERMIASGNVPDAIFISTTWEDGPATRKPFDGEALLTRLVPFRHFFRDLTIFANQARRRGGFAAFYDEKKRICRQVAEERGYYFIAAQALYPDEMLPDDYARESDTPHAPYVRVRPPTNGPRYAALLELLQKHSIRAYIVPTYYRKHEFRESRESELAEAFEDTDLVSVLGPDYYTFPNSLFSDPVHLNREGAEVYTKRLWELYLAEGPAGQRAERSSLDPSAVSMRM